MDFSLKICIVQRQQWTCRWRSQQKSLCSPRTMNLLMLLACLRISSSFSMNNSSIAAAPCPRHSPLPHNRRVTTILELIAVCYFKKNYILMHNRTLDLRSASAERVIHRHLCIWILNILNCISRCLTLLNCISVFFFVSDDETSKQS